MTGLGGRRILVTGAASGIGRAFLAAAVAEGAVCAAIVRDDAEADRLRGLLPANRIEALDLALHAEIPACVARLTAALGATLDGMVSSAGVFDLRAALETDDAAWDAVLDVNLRASFVVAREAGRIMAAAGGGAIVLLSSQIGIVGHPRAAAYAASKGGVNGLVKALALELAPRGVRANAVAPGPIETPMTRVAREDPARVAAHLAAIPLGRYGRADEVAAAIRFLLCDESSFITGQILSVDGGVTAA